MKENRNIAKKNKKKSKREFDVVAGAFDIDDIPPMLKVLLGLMWLAMKTLLASKTRMKHFCTIP